MLVYAVCPDQLAFLSSPFSEGQKLYFPDSVAALPVLGVLTADSPAFGEAPWKDRPADCIVMTGNASGRARADALQKASGIPVFVLDAELNSLSDSLKRLAALSGEPDEAQELCQYVDRTLTELKQKEDYLPKKPRFTVYLARGEDGLGAVPDGESDESLFPLVGCSDACGAGPPTAALLKTRNPQVLLFSSAKLWSDASRSTAFRGLSAVKNGRYYPVPAFPYPWLGDSAGFNRLLGLRWLGNLLYPKVYYYDMTQETMRFYNLFYHCNLTDDLAEKLLGGKPVAAG